MTSIQGRRRLIVIILLGLALAGAVLRQLAAPGSTARDVGTLLMLLWLPIIGNIIGWLVARVWRRRQAAKAAAAAATTPASFEAGSAFKPHALVELTLRRSTVPAENLPLSAGEHRCALVVDNQGFSARWFVPRDEALQRGQAQALQIEFLAPAAALPRFPRDAAFRVLVGESFVGDGRVLQLLGQG